MSLTALTVATTVLSDVELLNGVGVPVIASAGTVLTGTTGFTFPFTYGTIVYFLAPSGNTATLTFVNPNTATAASNAPTSPVTGALTAATAYYFGPISSTFCNGSTGLVTVNVTGTITAARAGVFLLPGFTGTSHNPLDMNVSGVTDY